jgi:nitrite reductase (NAD(P)H)
MDESMIRAPKADWSWQKVCKLSDLTPTDDATTSCAVKVGDSQIAIFHVPKRGLYASQQMCPHKRFFGLEGGMIGEDKNKNVYVSCPLHKRNFILDSSKASTGAPAPSTPEAKKGSCSTDSGK